MNPLINVENVTVNDTNMIKITVGSETLMLSVEEAYELSEIIYNVAGGDIEYFDDEVEPWELS